MPRSNHLSFLEMVHHHNIDVANRELFLHSHINDIEDKGIDFQTAVHIEKNIRYLENINSSPILIHMHAPLGGNVDDANGIISAILSANSRVTILVYGGAVSASSVILQAADVRVLMPNALMMIHEGYISIEDNHKVVESTVERTKKEKEFMYDIFAKKCINGPFYKEKDMKYHQVKKHIEQMLKDKQDWYLTPTEAVNYGFADGIFGEKGYENMLKLKE